MDTNPEPEPLHVGTFVKLHYSDYKRVKIVEYRCPHGGHQEPLLVT